jgi:hypothetical protein
LKQFERQLRPYKFGRVTTGPAVGNACRGSYESRARFLGTPSQNHLILDLQDRVSMVLSDVLKHAKNGWIPLSIFEGWLEEGIQGGYRLNTENRPDKVM